MVWPCAKNGERVSEIILGWCPSGRRRIRKERPRNSWMQKVTTRTREK